MPSTYRVTTNTVHPLENDRFPGSFSWYPFGGDGIPKADTSRYDVTVRTAAELTVALKAAAASHLDTFPAAPAVKVYATPLRGERHVSGGKRASELPMVVRTETPSMATMTVESDGETYEFETVFAPIGEA
jgi:hypothetical protein